MSFEGWFISRFGVPVPQGLAEYLAEHPQGMENGFGPRLWTADAVRGETDDRDLAGKGVCIIGASDDVSHILLRARDGKVFIVDSVDHQEVDAWFSDVDMLITLLNLE